MTLNPTKYRRTLMVDVKTTNPTQPEPNPAVFPSTDVIAYVQLIADDGIQVVEAVFSGAPERDLLCGFWGAVRPDDVFYGCNAVERLAQLRQRTWATGLLSSGELDLRKIYRCAVVDTAGPRPTSSNARYRSAEALAVLLRLP
jgi:hypothetical protein